MTDFTLRNVIVHELLKETKKPIDPDNKIRFRDTVLDPTNNIVLKLIGGINELYGKKGNAAYYGVFKEELTERGPVPDAIVEYIAKKNQNTQDFIDVTVCIMEKLAKEVDKQSLASGGIIVFADYIRDGIHFFLVTMIKQKEGIRLSEKLEPELLEQLDLSKINQAARINFDRFVKYQNSSAIDKNDLSYLSFISTTSQQTASGYFIIALGCDKGISSNKATKSLPKEVMNFFEKNEELSKSSRDIKNEVISYLEQQSLNGFPARLSDVALIATHYMNHMEDDKKDELIANLIAYLNSEDIRIPVEFNVSKSGLNQILNVKYKGDGYSFNFEKALLGTTNDADICYNSSSHSLTFTKLPQDAIKNIEEALREKGIADSENEQR